MNTLAKAFGLRVLWSASRSHYHEVFGTWVLIGLKTQLKLAEYTAEVLIRQLIKQRNEYIRDLPLHYGRLEKDSEGEGYALGYVAAVKEMVKEFYGNEELKPRTEE